MTTEEKSKKKDDGDGNATYDANAIKVLGGLEGVRKRPAMYIGSTGKDGLHHLVYEILDNSIDEALAGHCTKINVTLNKDNSVTVEDNGRGIPVDIHPQYKKSAMEIVLTMLHAGGKFEHKAYLISGGLHGVGISVVNACSELMVVQVRREGKIHEQTYIRGNAASPVKVVGTYSGDTGTKVTFKPDHEIFSVLKYDYDTLENKIRELAFLNPGVDITLISEIDDKKENFRFDGGLIEFIKWLNRNKHPLHKPIYFKKKEDSTVVEISIQYNDSYYENIFGFVNTINTSEGGTHITGFKTALTRVINDYATKTNLTKDIKIEGDDVREGLTSIVSLRIKEPQFEGQTKTKLGNSEVKGYVDSIVTEGLSQYFAENPSIAKIIIAKILDAAKARLAAKKAKELVRRKNSLSSGGLPGKLADCSSKKLELTELYIVEGESAGGCFSGDTQIALADGRNLSFKDLINEHEEGKENFCYTIKENGSIGIERIENPRITKRNVNVIKIILDTDKTIICTPNHKFMLRDGNYKEAKNLTNEDSLMPFNKQISKIGGNHKITKSFDFGIPKTDLLFSSIKRIEFLTEKIDVYDIEVPKTHNFALASGIFVHNSAKQAREKDTQAILPLKGKILNVEKANPHKIFSNEEIATLTSAIGTGIGDTFELESLRYGKIIIMADADVDGQHISTLLLTFFFRFMPALIEHKRIFLAMPPLYKIRKGQTDHYVYTDEELDKLIKKIGGNPDVQRFKGLGEMNPQQLWDTTMNKKTRKLKLISVEDAIESDQIFSMLMGEEVEPRKNFIMQHAKEANLDV